MAVTDSATPSAYLQSLRRLLRTESPPEVVRRQDEEKQPPLGLLRRLGELGFLGLGMPEEWGGGGTMFDVTQMMEELGHHNLGLGHLVGRTMYGLQLLLHFGTDDQRRTWIPRLLSGSCVFSIGISEPDSGSDAASIKTAAIRDGADYVVNGSKMWTSSMGYAGLLLLATRTDTTAERHAGITTFLVDPKSTGIECSRIATIGDWSIGTYLAYYRDVRVPEDAILGGLGNGWKVITSHLARERLAMAARAVGAIADCLELATGYALQRKQFGHPIADFQAIQHKLADIRIDHQVSRAALYELARAVTEGTADVTDAAVVKTFCSEAWVRAADRGMQIFGGLGYTFDAPMQRHLRDSRLYVVGGGSAEVMRNLIARDVIRKNRRDDDRHA